VTYTLLWVGWILAFAIIEGVALHNDMPGDTLSEHTRKWFSVKTKLGRTIFLCIWAGFAVWFCVHIITGQF